MNWEVGPAVVPKRTGLWRGKDADSELNRTKPCLIRTSTKDEINNKSNCIFQEETGCWRLFISNIMTILFDNNWKGKDLNQFQIFFIRAILGAFIAVVITRMFYGQIHIGYVAGLAVIMVGLAYFGEFLRKRKSR